MKTLVSTMPRNFFRVLLLTWALTRLSQAQAAPSIISTVPVNGASGVSTSAPVVFTFSEEMDPDATDVVFYDPSFNFFTTSPAWNPAHTTLTCTPSPGFPANKQITWVVTGQNPAGDSLGGLPIGGFTTGSGSGSGGGGSGTNAITTFSVGKVHHYNQTSAGSPTLDPTTPYDFSGVTSLSSNRTATNVNLTIPTLPIASVSNLTQIPYSSHTGRTQA